MKENRNVPRIVKRGGVVSTLSLRIEGPVVSRWLPILALQSRWLLRDGETTQLDLTGVTEIDTAGTELLKALTSTDGVGIVGCSSLVAKQLSQDASPVPD